MNYKDIVKTYDEVDPLIKLSLVELSNSRLETFEGDWGCEAKYFYNYILRERDESGPPALLGNVVHSVLENKLEAHEPIDIDAMIEEYEVQLEKQDTTSMLDEEMRQLGIVLLEDFYSTNKDTTFNILGKEQWFSIVVGRANVRGYIDRIDIDGDLVRVVDYKTGRKEITAKGAKDSMQLGIYALAMKTMYPDKDVYAGMYYLRTGRQKGHLFTDDDLNGVVDRLLDISKRIMETNNFKPTDNKRICNYCSHAASGLCPSGKR